LLTISHNYLVIGFGCCGVNRVKEHLSIQGGIRKEKEAEGDKDIPLLPEQGIYPV